MRKASRFLGAHPLLPPALAAAGGILAADYTDFPFGGVLAVTLALSVLALGQIRRDYSGIFPGVVLLLFTGATFCLLHILSLRTQQLFPLASALQQRGALYVIASGLVADEPRAVGTGDQWKFSLKLDSIVHRNKRFHTWHRVLVSIRGNPPLEGERVAVEGKLTSIRRGRNPGESGMHSFLMRSGVAGQLFVSSPARMQVTGQRDNGGPAAIARKSRDWITETITRDLADAPDVASVLPAMVLGNRNNTPDSIQTNFRYSGALHVFAVSGLHVGIFGTILWGLLRFIGIRPPLAVPIVVLFLFFYAFLTGWRPSAVRAAIMATVFLGGFPLKRPPRVLNSLSAAAIIILGLDPQQLFLPGFQLSFIVLACIATLVPVFYKPLKRWSSPDPFIPRSLVSPGRRIFAGAANYGAGLISVSAAAWIGSLPLVLWHFQLVTPVAVVANAIMTPIAFVVLSVAAASMLCAACGASLIAILFNNANLVVTKFLLLVNSFFAAVPGGHFHTDRFVPFQSVPCRVSVLDTSFGGAAHCIRLKNPRHTILVDAGGKDSAYHTLIPFLRVRGISSVDDLVITHGDAQHFAGALRLLHDFRPASISGALARSRSPHDAPFFAAIQGLDLDPLRELSAGDRVFSFPDHQTELEVLYPPPGGLAAARTADDHCLIVRLHYCGWKLLFMSDSGFVAEKWLLDRQEDIDLRSHVIIKGRHRSDFSGLPEFINAVAPEVIVSTHAGFPDSERIPEGWRRKIAAKDIALFDQSRTGAVEIDLSPSRLKVKSYLTAQTYTARRQVK